MTERLSADDIRDFAAYLRNCTDAQVQGVFDKEREAGRLAYAELALLEARSRKLDLYTS
jgi:hypothetical protein